jgi:enoyl-CoA hydratase/carnithine racemase
MAEMETMAFSERVGVTIVDGVAEILLDRPDKLNALDRAMFDGLIAAGERVSREKGVRAVVLTGAGRGFCAGLDTRIFASIAAGSREAALGDIVLRTHGNANAAQEAALVWRGVPVPVIAAIHGPCFGGGFQIALGADVRYVAPDARLAILEIKWGIVPDMGGIALMRGLARGDVIRELAFTGRELTGAEAVAYGFATAVHPDPLAAARATAREIAGKSPDAIRALKRLLNMSADGDTVSILLAESKEQARLIGSPNQIEAIRAGVEKRPPRFADPE